MTDEVIGRVAALWRFPVKSMAGEPMDAVDLGWTGLRGDRQYAFLRHASLSRFPWFTGRDANGMLLYRAAYRDPADPKLSPIDVTTPEGETLPLDAEALRARLGEEGGMAVDLVRSGRSFFDAMPVSLVTTATHDELDAASGDTVDPRRFRINIVIESDGREGDWVERMLAFGDAADGPRMIVHYPIDRCVMVTIDPDTGVRTPAVLKTVVRDFDNRIGVYASAARTGTIRLGDTVRLL
jgi:uncharacterized protein YcbX